MIENQISWHLALPNAHWADRVTPKNSLGVSPYTLVYRKEAILPPNIMLPSSILYQEYRGTDNEILWNRIYNIVKAKDSISRAKERFKQQQEVVKRWFDKHKDGTKEFEVGDLVLKWDHPHDEKGKHTKFQQLWVGPFQIAGQALFRLQQNLAPQPTNCRIYRGGKRTYQLMVQFSNLIFPDFVSCFVHK